MSAGPEVRRGLAGEVDEVVDILSEAARWLLSRGIRQWPDPFPRERLEALAARGELFLARSDGETVATLALLWTDPIFWGEQPDDAGYVHALAVRRASAGRGVGARLLECAGERVAAAGRDYLRLDCRAENRPLRRYYERYGFEPRGVVVVEGFTSALYERRCRVRGGDGERGGEIGAVSTRSGHRRVTSPPLRSQRERGWTPDPTQKGGGALGR